jgi:hypothetical protein
MNKIEQMDYLVMNLGIGLHAMRVFSCITQGVLNFHVFNKFDEEVYTSESIHYIESWYWKETALRFNSWKEMCEVFHENGTEMYMKDQRLIYEVRDNGREMYLCRMYELAYYFYESENPTYEGFIDMDE